jgi:hypothetical protein
LGDLVKTLNDVHPTCKGKGISYLSCKPARASEAL